MYDHLHEIAARAEHQQHLQDLRQVQVPVRPSRFSMLRASVAALLRRRREATPVPAPAVAAKVPVRPGAPPDVVVDFGG